MSVTDKTRKLLWGHSGNRCAICKTQLIMRGNPVDNNSVIGEECHIISKKPGGPRYTPNFPADKLDNYENLILLCPIDHKKIDDQPQTYTSEKLREIKKQHQQWVSETLNKPKDAGKWVVKRIKGNIPQYLVRLTTGKELMDMIVGVCVGYFDHDELETEYEVGMVGDFLQETQDLVDIGSELESGERVRMGYTLSKGIKQLEDCGFWIFGAREIQRLESDGRTSDWPVVYLKVLRKANPGIIRLKLQ